MRKIIILSLILNIFLISCYQETNFSTFYEKNSDKKYVLDKSSKEAHSLNCKELKDIKIDGIIFTFSYVVPSFYKRHYCI